LIDVLRKGKKKAGSVAPCEVGSQGVVFEIMNGKRELNVRQIKALTKRFDVPPAVFLR
jgi:antitoxin component HigA of HigAB toxin-antitoxin module